MRPEKKIHPKEKANLHPRSKHRERYNFKALIASCPALRSFVKRNEYGDESVDFFDPLAVKTLNKALLSHFYGIKHWDIPPHYLTPPIPGRADYIHHVADLLADSNHGSIPTGHNVKCLDVGTGASCIYPIIGDTEYGWSFIGSDIDPVSIKSSETIVKANTALKGKIELRLQKEPNHIFKGIIQKDECFDLTLCNPPFHASLAEAQAGTTRKLSNLKQQRIHTPTLNFGGQKAELWCKGGEKRFIEDMVRESSQFSTSCFWFTSLVSKEANLKPILQTIKAAGATASKTIPMGQGNKVSRLVAWTFLTKEQQQQWAAMRWQRK